MAVKIQLRGDTQANWALANPVIADREMVLETDTLKFKIGNGVSTYTGLPYGGIQGPAQTNSLQDFGNGEDGDVVISAGIITLTQDTFYNNLTISGTGQLRTNGYRVFVKGTLDLTACGADAISNSGLDGANAAAQTGAAGGVAYVAATLGANTAGGSGATGVVGAGAIATASTATTPSNGGSSGNGGAGGSGNGGANAGGALRAGSTATVPSDFARFCYDIIRGATLVQAGAGGPGGSSGGGDGVNLGRGGGGGGAGGGILYLAARNILKSAITPARAICACGGRGGNGAGSVLGNNGGGGGGAGGGGGYLILFYQSLAGPVIADLLQASGGDGGSGGNGNGTGVGGSSGAGGNGGRVRKHRTLDQVGTTLVGANGSASNPGVGNVGGASSAGGACKVSL